MPVFSLELKEIARVGDTKPANQYYQNINLKSVRLDIDKATGLLKSARESITRDIFFPLKPATMRPGIIKGHRFDSNKRIQPFAVAGSDELSLKWLKFRFEKLKELNAPIYIVEAESFDLLSRLATQFKGLKFVPSSGDKIGEDLKVKAYPFLVTSSGVWQ